MAPYRRVETRDLQGPDRLQVSQVSGDTYAPPERPVQNDNMGRLARSLEAFSGDLASYSQRHEVDLRRQQAEEEKRRKAMIEESTARYLAATPRSQVAQDVREGKAPYQSDPVAQGALHAAVGTELGANFRQSLEKDFGPEGSSSLLTADGQPVNLDDIVAQRIQPWLEQVPGGTPHGAEAILRAKDGALGYLRERQQAQMSGYAAKARGGTIAVGFGNVLNSADLSGLPPEKVSERIRSAYAELHGVTKATWNELDDGLMGSLKTAMASGNVSPQMARNIVAVLGAPRSDAATGQSIGSLAQNPRFHDDATLLLNKAQGVLAKDFDAQQEAGAIAASKAAFAAGDGSFDRIQDFVAPPNPFAGGARKIIKAEELRDKAATLQSNETRERVQAQFRGQPANVVNQHAFEADARQFIDNGIKNPVWENTLKNVLPAVGDVTSLSDPASQRRLQQAANLYEVIRTRNPGYANTLLDQRSRDFFEAYHDLRKMGQASPQAIEGAIRAIDPALSGDAQVNILYKEIDSAANDLGKTDSVLGRADVFGWLQHPPTNWVPLRNEVARRAKLIARTQGITPKAAIEQAKKGISEEVPVVNGWVQLDRSPFLVKGKEPVAERFLSDTYAQNSEALRAQGVNDPSRLSIRFENGAYSVINGATGMPVFSAAHGRLMTTDQRLRAVEKVMSTEHSAATLADRKAAAEARDAGQKVFQGTPAAPLFDFLTDPQGWAKLISHDTPPGFKNQPPPEAAAKGKLF